MSDRVMAHRRLIEPLARRIDTRKVLIVLSQSGFGMFEFLIALLIFSTGMMGLLSTQLAGKKAGYEASQRSVATALARDILERMRANADQIAAYQVTNAGDETRRLPVPTANCDTSACSAPQLAAFDVWQWESHLLGELEQYAGGYAGGLLAPRACVTANDGEVTVAISWLDAMSAGKAPVAICDIENGKALEAGEADSSMRRRHQLSLSTFIGRH